MEIRCFNCAHTLEGVATNAYFCPSCLIQLKCKECNELLIKGASGCIYCGKEAVKRSSNESSMNQIEFEQKGDLRKFKATFSDNVGHDLVNTFGGMVVGLQIPKKKHPLALGHKLNAKGLNEENVDEAQVLEDDDEIKEALRNVFKIDGNGLVFQLGNLKARNKLEKEIRMSLLVLLGYKHLHNSAEIKRKSLTDILKKSKLNSSNFRRWISKCNEIVQSSGGLISLTPTGNIAAVKILDELLDQSIELGTVEFSKAPIANKRKTGEGGKRKSDSKVKSNLLRLIEEGFFSHKRTLSGVITHLKDKYALTLQTTDISGHMSQLTKNGKLKREKGPSGYEYFV